MTTKPNRFKLLSAFAIIYFVWGSTFIGIRFSLVSFPPFLLAGLRFSMAGGLLLVWAWLKTDQKPKRTQVKQSTIAGFFMIFIGHGCLSWSEQFIPSGMAALILATIPIWMIFFEWLQHRQKPHLLTFIGIPVGLYGVFLLADLDQSILIQTSGGMTVFKGVLILTSAAISWGFGSVYARRIAKTISLSWIVGIQICSAGLGLIILGTVTGEWIQLAESVITLKSIYAMIYLILIGSVLAYSAYMWLLQVSTPAKVGTYAYFNPVVAIFLGAMLAGEQVTMPMILGGVLILCSLLMVNLSKHSS